MKKYYVASFGMFVLPSLALAEQQVGVLIRNILNFLGDVVNFAGPFLIALALVAFFWSLVRFLYDKDKTQESKDFLIWSVLILFIMVSIWGIIGFFQENLGIRNDNNVSNNLPVVNVGDVRY
jgi:uncharacterized protein with PQ loop repeat